MARLSPKLLELLGRRLRSAPVSVKVERPYIKLLLAAWTPSLLAYELDRGAAMDALRDALGEAAVPGQQGARASAGAVRDTRNEGTVAMSAYAWACVLDLLERRTPKGRREIPPALLREVRAMETLRSEEYKDRRDLEKLRSRRGAEAPKPRADQ